MMKRAISLTLALLVVSVPQAYAQNADDWQIKVGVHVVDPGSNNGRLAGGTLQSDVGSGVSTTITLEYSWTPSLGIELLAALPFEHDVRLNGTKAATVKQLPPTVSLQWHFRPGEHWNPFAGVGLNYTRFFSIDEHGPLTGTRLNLSDSWGLAAHAGIEYSLDPRWSVTADVRWMKIATEAKVNGAKVGTVTIDPMVYGVAVGYRY